MLSGMAAMVREKARPWCRVCRCQVSHVETSQRFDMMAVEARTICHGVPGRVTIPDDVFVYGSYRLLAAALEVYDLAPLMLPPIPSPAPRVLGRGPSRVFLAPPIEVAA